MSVKSLQMRRKEKIALAGGLVHRKPKLKSSEDYFQPPIDACRDNVWNIVKDQES